MTTHRTITIDPTHGTLGCTCGEDHGPSLREERDWALVRISTLEGEVFSAHRSREKWETAARRAARRLAHLRIVEANLRAIIDAYRELIAVPMKRHRLDTAHPITAVVWHGQPEQIGACRHCGQPFIVGSPTGCAAR